MNSNPSNLISYCSWAKKNSKYKKFIGDLFCKFTLYNRENFVFNSPLRDALKSTSSRKTNWHIDILSFYSLTKGLGFHSSQSHWLTLLGLKKNIIIKWLGLAIEVEKSVGRDYSLNPQEPHTCPPCLLSIISVRNLHQLDTLGFLTNK